MSQVVYTELEGQPLRWVYKGTVPRESRKEADRTSKTWSVSTTPTTQIQNVNIGWDNDVFSMNMVAQPFPTSSNAVKITGIQVYGRKVGSPPNSLMVEMRRAEYKPFIFGTTVDPNFTTTGVKTLLTMNTSLPAGGRNVIIAVYLGNAAFTTGAQGRFQIRKGNTVLYETYVTEVLNDGRQNGKPVMLIAVDNNPAGNDSYTFTVNVTTAGTASGAVHVQGIVIKTNDATWSYNTTGVSIPNGTTATVTSMNVDYSSDKKVVTLAFSYGYSSDVRAITAGNIRLKLNATVVSSNEFHLYSGSNDKPFHANLGWYGTAAAGTRTWSVEIYNDSGATFVVYAIIVSFTVEDGAFLDTGSVGGPSALATIGSLATTLSGNVVVIGLASAFNWTTVDYTLASGEVLCQINNAVESFNRVSWALPYGGTHGMSGILPLLRYDTNVSSPSYQIKMRLPEINFRGEAKIIAFIGQAQVFGDTINLLERLHEVVASGSIAPASVGTSNAWINITLSGTNIIVLRPNESYVILFYTVGGDTSNKYVLQSGTVSFTSFAFATSTDAGTTWRHSPRHNLAFKIDGVSYVQLYNGTIPNNIVTPLGKVITALIIRAQTSSSMEFAGFDDHTYTAPVVSSNASSQTFITVLKPEDPRLRDVPPSDTLSWSIWAAGSGLSTGAYTQRHTYYTANPVYPKDFGFGELYLTADEIPPQGLVVLNDNTAAALYNPTTETKKTMYELFRIPVRKIEVIQEPTSGNIVLYLIGIP